MGVDLDEDSIRDFYKRLWLENDKHPSRHWNGRQIKNAFQTAIALAHWEFNNELSSDRRSERPVVRARHFKRVAKTSAHFDDYMGSVYGIEEEDTYSVLAAREEIRKDTGPALALTLPKETRPMSTRKVKLSRHAALPQESNVSSESDDDFVAASIDIGNGLDDSDSDVSERNEDVDQMKYERELAKLKKRYGKR